MIEGFVVGETITREIILSTQVFKSMKLKIVPLKCHFFYYEFDCFAELSVQNSVKIFIRFVPFEYKVYKSELRIFYDERCLLINLEAYPVMNIDLSFDFPETVDLGNQILNETMILVKEVKSKIDARFKFEFEPLSDFPELQIWPMVAIVPENGVIPVKFTFTPTQNRDYTFSVKVI